MAGIVKPLSKVLRTLPCRRDPRCLVSRSHIDTLQPHLHDIFFLPGKGHIALLVHDHPLIQHQPRFILGDYGSIGNTRNNKFAVIPSHKQSALFLKDLDPLCCHIVKGGLLSAAETEKCGNAVWMDGVHQSCQTLHGVGSLFFHLLISRKPHSLKFSSAGLVQLHIRHDAEPDGVVKLVLIIGSVQIGKEPGQVAGFYHHIQGRVAHQKFGTHPFFLHLILVKEDLDAQDLFNKGFHRFHKVVLALFIELQILVVMAHFQLPVNGCLHS